MHIEKVIDSTPFHHHNQEFQSGVRSYRRKNSLQCFSSSSLYSEKGHCVMLAVADTNKEGVTSIP